MPEIIDLHHEAQSERAYQDGLRDGQRDWSGSNYWTHSVHWKSYCEGFAAGSKLRDERIAKEV